MRQAVHEDRLITTLILGRSQTIRPAQFLMFCEDMPDHIQELLPHLNMKVFGKEDDRHVAHIKLETPMIMENRSFVCLTYQKEGNGNDDEHWFALSTRYNE